MAWVFLRLPRDQGLSRRRAQRCELRWFGAVINVCTWRITSPVVQLSSIAGRLCQLPPFAWKGTGEGDGQLDREPTGEVS